MFSDFDTSGLLVAVTFLGLAASVGFAIDALLLRRQVEWLNDISLKWWNFFDDLSPMRAPRAAIEAYIAAKSQIIGPKFNRSFMLRAALSSILVPFFAAGLLLQDQDPTLWIKLSLIPIFFFLTIYVTVWLLERGLAARRYGLVLAVFLDVLVCAAVIQASSQIVYHFGELQTEEGLTQLHGRPSLSSTMNALQTVITTSEPSVTLEDFEAFESLLSGTETSGGGDFRKVPQFIAWEMSRAEVSSATPGLLAALPSLIYIGFVVVLVLLSLSFIPVRYALLHILELGTERKTLLFHVCTAGGLTVAVGKLVLELVKVFS